MRAPVLQLAFLFGIAPVGFGSTDISGKWGVRAQTTSGPAATVGCLVEMSKSGMALSVAGSCQLIGAVTLAGTIDATAGTLTASGHSESFCSRLTINGSVAPDGTSFRGTFDCVGPVPASGTRRLSASRARTHASASRRHRPRSLRTPEKISRPPCKLALASARLVQTRKPAPARFTVAWIASARAPAMRSGCASRVAAHPLAAAGATATTAASSALAPGILCFLSR